MALSRDDERFIRMTLKLAARGYGQTSPNPMVGALLVKQKRIIGRGWHQAAGKPHAEIEAISDARKRGHDPKNATLYVSLEPCCTFGRTPPCTHAIISAQIKTVVAGGADPNPKHCGKGFALLRRAGIEVVTGILEDECEELNVAFNHWIVHRTPLITVKAAMSLDGKIALASGESKWITSKAARKQAMKLRQRSDAILVGINTILADDPKLTVRDLESEGKNRGRSSGSRAEITPRRIVLDAMARTPLDSKVAADADAERTTIVISKKAPKARVAALVKQGVNVIAVGTGSARHGSLDLVSLMKILGQENITSLLVEGGGEVNASFLLSGLTHRIAFFYAPKILGGRGSIRAVGGGGIVNLNSALRLTDVYWQKLGPDLLLTAGIDPGSNRGH